jgi:antitoxin component YwqK of YwqJK toxin-antitoxin module
MKYLYLLIIVGLSSNVIGQGRYHVDKTNYYASLFSDEVICLKYDMKPITGVVYCDHGDMGKLINGKKNGVWKDWHNSGQISDEGFYRDDKKVGIHRSWCRNGTLGSECGYEDGEQHGIQRAWYCNGQLKLEQPYENGYPIGVHKWWYEDSQKMSETPWGEYGIDGVKRFWHSNGRLKYEGTYKHNKIIRGQCWDRYGNPEKCASHFEE